VIALMKESCAVTGLLHVLVKTNDLPRTLVFYKSVLGLREAQRPPFGFPGAWMGCATANGELVIHIWAGGPGKDGVAPYGTATIDHVSLSAVGYRGFQEKFERYGLPWREFVIPNTTLFQLFVYDPSGVQIELTFDLGAEPSYDTHIDPAHRYSPGEVFFDFATYPDLLASEKASDPR
jgi:catechol 2,3-dioxygenase-like lactoylglutathione lyase family enzyme